MANESTDLNLFRVFAAVYRTGSFTRAAAELHVTQPAVSNALARLRRQTGDALFIRDGRRIVPTPTAKAMAPDVLGALETLHGSIRRVERFDPAASRRKFVIAMRESMELPLLVPLLREAERRAPGIRMQSVALDRKTVARQLLAGDVDLAIDVPIAVGGEVRGHPLFEAELCLALRKGHPLLRKPLTLDRWLAARHVVVSGRATGPVLEDLALERRGGERDVAVRCQSYYAACHLVATSDLVLALPRFFGEWFQGQLPLKLAALPIEAPALQLMLYWSRGNDTVAGHAWLRRLVQELAGEG